MKNKQSLPQYIIAPREVSNTILETVYPELNWIPQRLPDSKKKREEKIAVVLHNKNPQ